jgi:hypothetical protein
MIYGVTHALFAFCKNNDNLRYIHRGEDNDFEGIEWTSPPEFTRPTNQELQRWIFAQNSAEPMRLLRIERDKRIAATDWWASADLNITAEQIAYRQSLRDLPNTANPTLLANGNLDLNSINWPVKP